MGAASQTFAITTAEVWKRARAVYAPGTPIVRYIDLEAGMQFFEELPQTEQNFFDGATIVRPSIPGGRDEKNWQDIIDTYDAKFFGVEP
jgi:hypothetical protein